MIRMVASDLDGTLLQNGKRVLPDGCAELIHQLTEQGILFTAASGRQYANMQRLFEPVKDEIAYICENGSLVVHQGEVIYKNYIEKAIGDEILKSIREREGCEILLSGVETSYLEPKSESYAEHMQFVVKNNITIVDNILDVKEDYLKISVYEKSGVVNSEAYFKEKFGDIVTVVTSGNLWLDMIPKGVNKGKAIEMLMEKMSIKPEECMAFGDHFNDVEMLEAVKYGYAMDNAQDKIKELCNYHTDRVESVLKLLLE